ncbi:MAG: hypothetical protein ABIL09_07085 [Gemmatimonadota bacterium]
MQLLSLGQPCRNFQILGIGRFIDPRDEREKVVLSNFAAGSTGSLVIVDPGTGAGEDIRLPGDSGAWAVLNWRDEKLLIGTCGSYGYLHCLDLATRQWAEPLRDPNETYIWNLCVGSDGVVYGGTYPGCVLLRYHPDEHRLENLGRVSDAAGNLYSRTVYGGIPGHILIACGTAEPHLALWSMATGQARRFGRPGASVREIGPDFVCTQTGDQRDFYDLHTLEPLNADLSGRLSAGGPPPRFQGMSMSIQLADGRTLATRGQEYYIDAGGPELPALRPIPAERPATHILTVTADEGGRIWGAAGFGQTIFRCDPATGESWNSQVVTDKGGEVYGMAAARGRLFLATYSGGDHVVYDPEAAWSQIDNTNPRTLEPVGPRLIRPAAKSVIGPDGHFWTGWMAAYGVYGGGLSRVKVDTLDMTSWYDPVPGQALAGLAADDRHLYFTTSGAANGLSSREVTPHFAVWDAEGQIAWERVFAAGTVLGPLAAVAGRVLLVVGQRLEIFDPESRTFTGALDLPAPCLYLAALPDGRAAAFGADHLWLIDSAAGQVTDAGAVPGRAGSLAVTPDDQVYVAIGTDLYHMEL